MHIEDLLSIQLYGIVYSVMWPYLEKSWYLKSERQFNCEDMESKSYEAMMVRVNV